MAIQISDFRLSLLWVETSLNLLGDKVPHDAPLAFLGRRYSYAPWFEKVLRGNASRGAKEQISLTPPWPETSRQQFWRLYLEGKQLDNINGNQAWKALVPFRVQIPFSIQSPLQGVRITVESFFYPHAIALGLTARCQGSFTLTDAVNTAFSIKRGQYTLKGPSETWSAVSLQTIADKAFAVLRTYSMGSAASPGQPVSLEPFTIFTVVKGDGVDPNIPTPDKQDVHRALEAVTSWRLTWQNDTLPDLAQASLKIRSVTPSHLVYSAPRGRAIWFPGLFTLQDSNIYSLASYHRNLFFATLQVESLCGLIVEMAKLLRGNTPLSPAHEECARNAAGILGRLYGGTYDTYRSWSTRAQIEQNNLIADINEVRKHFPPMDSLMP